MSTLPPSSPAASTAGMMGAVRDPVSAKVLRPDAGPSLKQRALHSSAWTFVGQVMSQGLRFGSNLLLTYLLVDPDQAFGLMMFVALCMAGLEMFSDVGIGPSVIQNPRGSDPEYLNTAWTIQVIRGFALWLGAAALAYPVSIIWDEPALRYLLPVVGITAAIAGFNATSLFTLNRDLTIGKVVSLNLFTQVVVAATMIAWTVLVDPSVWALVAGGIAGACTRMTISHLLVPHTNRFHWDPDAARELYRFGRWIFLSTLLTFMAGRIDKFIFPTLLGFDLFGVYSIAFNICIVVPTLMRSLNSVVGFAALADVYRRDPARFRWRLRHVRMLLILPTNAALLALAAFGPWAIDLIYPDLFHEAGWMLTALAVGAMATSVISTYANAHLAMGDSLCVTISVAAQLLMLIPAVLVSYDIAGAVGFIYASTGVLWLLYPVHMVMAIRKGIWQPELDLPVLLTCGAAGAFLMWP